MSIATQSSDSSDANGILVSGTSFALHGKGVSYCFHADSSTGDLVSDHFGGPITELGLTYSGKRNGWVGTIGSIQREFPDLGRGDFRVPAVQIRHAKGSLVTALKYQSHTLQKGKQALPGLPSTFGGEQEVSTLVIQLYDDQSLVAADLSYSIFPESDAIVRSVKFTNKGKNEITIEKAASLSVDFPNQELDLIGLRGDWAREATKFRRRVEYGVQGFGSLTGYSSHLHNPFVSLVTPSATETQGEAWGFSLVYSGSFSVEVEKGSLGMTRAAVGLNSTQLSWPLAPGETFTTPECIAVYSSTGLGGLSRKFHDIFRNNLMRSKYATEVRPALLNSWEGLHFKLEEKSILDLAKESAELGAKLFVLDDGWFGVEYPRTSDKQGLGDWEVNPARFPNGLPEMVKQITLLETGKSSEKLKFGLWFEPEMVSPNSSLYLAHPDWALHSAGYPRTEQRNQLVLDLGRPEVQDYIIDSVSKILESTDISYVKWDNNRGIHETEKPYIGHMYMLGMYRVFDVLTNRFPDILWEGCASGGGRFDPGILQYFPQVWTSDNTDALDRITIQFGTSLVYPPSSMGAHISAVPNKQNGRVTPIEFRGHVAMMGGSFGLELNPPDIPADERAQIPALMALAERVNPIVVKGDLWRLNLPEESNWPAALFISKDGANAVLFCFQIQARINYASHFIRLQGLDPKSKYTVDGDVTLSGATLMNMGLQYQFAGDYTSRVVFIDRM